MSININAVIFAGNLTRDPETRQAGAANVCSFTLANNRKVKDQDETTFLDVECWGKTAELAQQYLHKGEAAVVEGRLKQENWTDKDGNKRSRVKIVAEKVHFVGGGKREGGESAPRQARPAPASADGEAPF
jgi:single-strand DNA-binding protein